MLLLADFKARVLKMGLKIFFSPRMLWDSHANVGPLRNDGSVSSLTAKGNASNSLRLSVMAHSFL